VNEDAAISASVMSAIEDSLRDYVRREEEAADQGDRAADSLWDHPCRTAEIAEQLGQTEGLDLSACRLGALFHDAGKFYQGQRHGDPKKSTPSRFSTDLRNLKAFPRARSQRPARRSCGSIGVIPSRPPSPGSSSAPTTWKSSDIWERPTSSSNVASGVRVFRLNSWPSSLSS